MWRLPRTPPGGTPRTVCSRTAIWLAAGLWASALLLGQSPIPAEQTVPFLDRTRSVFIDYENSKPGTDAWRLLRPARAGELEGYAYSPSDRSPGSVSKGGALDIRVNTVYPRYRLRLFRMGYYDGLNATEIALPQNIQEGRRQVMPEPDKANFNVIVPRWEVSYSFRIPDDPTQCPSGFYLLQLTGLDGAGTDQGQRHVPFIVRDDARSAAVLVKLGFSTDQAYNGWHDAAGALGQSLYAHTSKDGRKAVKVSLLRPHDFGGTAELEHIVQLVALLERHSLDVAYTTGADIDARGFLIPSRNRVVLFAGHDEYWSKNERDYIDAAKASGVALVFWGANQCYRQVRYEEYLGMPYAVMVCFKESWAQDPVAQANPRLATTEFRSAQVDRPEWYLIGTYFHPNNQLLSSVDMRIESVDDVVMQGTGFKAGDVVPNIVGYEYNIIPMPYQLAYGAVPTLTVLAGADFGTARAPMRMTIYRAAPHNNFVFSGSTIDLMKLGHPGIQKLLLNLLAEASQSSYSWKVDR